MTQPNLFSFATSELTQDALLAYLLAWADPKHAATDPEMHTAGTEFLRLLLEAHGITLTTVTTLEVRTQEARIDVLVYVALAGRQPVVLVVEDKVHAGSYNVLEKYLKNARKKYDLPEERFLGIYLRTGNQADYSAIEAAKFRVIDRQVLLDYFRAEATGEPANAIFQNYRRYLENYQSQLDAYKRLPVSAWDGNAWVGFFRQELIRHETLLFDGYQYVQNKRGGFQGCFWTAERRPLFNGFTIYLQIEGSNTATGKSRVAVKMHTLSAKEAKARGIERIDHVRALADAIQALPDAERHGLLRPRLRAGQWMTAAQVEAAPELSPQHEHHSLRQLLDLQKLVLKLCA